MSIQKKIARGFTLIELLIVIAIIAILAAVVFVALNPLQRFKDSRDARRWSNVTELLSAIKLSQVDLGGSYVASLQSAAAGTYMVGTAANGCDAGCDAIVTAAACLDLTGLVTSGHLGSIPMDPSSGTAAKTLYYLTKSATGTVTVGACVPEGSAAISVAR
jgi:prepilin-type N-terminal cleavage/methylation domain-containing protein